MAIIKQLFVHQFRNLSQQHLIPSTTINLFIGDNAQGKTSLIESIYYLGHNRSFKTKSLKEVTAFNCQRFQLSAQLTEHKIKLEKSTKNNTISINNQIIQNSSKLSQILPIQLITPDKGFVVNGTPKIKRSYIDWGVFHVKPDSINAFKTYQKVLKNINSLISKQQTNELDFWFFELAKSAAEINQNRSEYIEKLKQITHNKDINKYGELINSIEKFDFKYMTGWPSEVDANNAQSIVDFLIKNKNNILKLKYLNYGVHKANIVFEYNDKKEMYLSRGEQKTLSIIFWLNQVLLLNSIKNNPIVLLDDLSSELDNKKINFILMYLKQLNVQTFVTDIGNNIGNISTISPTIFYIDKGVISRKSQ